MDHWAPTWLKGEMESRIICYHVPTKRDTSSPIGFVVAQMVFAWGSCHQGLDYIACVDLGSECNGVFTNMALFLPSLLGKDLKYKWQILLSFFFIFGVGFKSSGAFVSRTIFVTSRKTLANWLVSNGFIVELFPKNI